MKIVAIILAGGNSSRMGKNKALLPYNGKRLVDHIANQLILSGIKNIIISGSVEGYECIPDIIKNGGPLVGIATVISKIYGDYDSFLILPVDLPLLNSDVINQLINNNNNCDVICFKSNPLPFKINKSSALLAKLNSSNFIDNSSKQSVKSFLSKFNTQILELSDRNINALTNTNTPNEWELAIRQTN
ncbi:molybdenum cofactor guanylyltransferase [Pseudaquidulcibacter saccharophilus]|uniref:molybdenum cofactor guanylyltransferase n=1 Tax=Pseudaquidulcibacter saccharophilus TaxID=2831900 RepID=UPI001EFF0C02|nr:molybdenum cofactor guanylyltransferase [Pseudaquidulcibacter saccharophilus]